MDTIFALSTAPGKAGVAVIRVSGSEAFRVGKRLCGSLPAMHRASLRSIRKADGGLIDEGLVICFPEGKSFTGENTVEFQVHGSRAVISLIESELLEHGGVRAAKPGEFTKRALMNDRLDLTQVEALSDLIEAETEAQHEQAMETLSGRLAKAVSSWREGLLATLSLVEMMIDFSDEELPANLLEDISSRLVQLKTLFQDELEGSRVSERIRNGFEIAIIGPPNSGKSTLLNYIAGREAAITSEIAGTTRDVIEVRMDLYGLPVTLIDTAGLRETSDPIEAKGVQLAKSRASSADVRIHLIQTTEQVLGRIVSGDLFVGQKADSFQYHGLAVSGVTGEGVGELLKQCYAYLNEKIEKRGFTNNERHRSALTEALIALDRAQSLLNAADDNIDIVAEELRHVVHALDVMVGKIGVEDVLGKIFSTFCMGK